MGDLHVALVDLSVNHGGVDALVPEQLLHLLDGHPFVYRHGRQGTAEFVRMDIGQVQFPPQLAKPNLDAADLQPLVWAQQRHEERGIVVGT